MAASNLTTPNILVLGASGLRSFLQLGALRSLEQAAYLSRVETVVGVSAGAILALLWVLGYTINEIINLAIKGDFFPAFQDLSSLRWDQLNLNTRSGVFSIEPLKQQLATLIREKFGVIPTLEQLYQATGRQLITITYNLTQNQTEYLSKDSNANLSCLDAVILSVNWPLLYYKINYEGDVCIDGSFGDPYPVRRFDEGKNQILGIYVETAGSTDGIFNYIYKIANTPFDQMKRQAQRMCSARCQHLTLYSSLDEGVTSDTQRAEMIAHGYKAGEQFLHPASEILVLRGDRRGSQDRQDDGNQPGA